ncbi:phosphoribosylglycinamide formyltransferase [Litoribacter ruber]|uniref:Phosphoribosylglycinamide formyltransferase n=1 Tax=Litoribacter ruber TaxID=702568 RepID=A0AAP2CKT6_9BACT|nr:MULTISPECIES: phosphoribosylglycinamide formyltransferase [Litoribacter]MBS9523647.1 phosphoribosylglycinamide formyltransferase [Litoribacter alkaliphilus]MBT0812161.1 phosphoribosylglycinamide formyltransferase [Litoribacter ruber]
MKKIAILASGSGTNAEKIIQYFQDSEKAKVAVVASNKKDAFVLERAKKYDIPTFHFDKSDLEEGLVGDQLAKMHVDLIVLAGFLLKIPDQLVQDFPDKIINIHPALLPKYGGKGMYGMRVHQAVKEAGDAETGITIHYVNEKYDEGRVIFQESVELSQNDDPESIAEKVHALEHKYFPKVIESLL